MRDEIWKPVVGYEGLYEVSSLGRVNRIGSQKVLKPTAASNGYLTVGLSKDGVKKTHAVHRLVALMFLGECPSENEVCHNDGQKSNCQLSNLRYGTRKENHSDKWIHGTEQIGERIGNACFTNEQVIQIKQMLKTGAIQSDIAKQFGVHKSTISLIHNNKSWKYINA